MATLSVVIPTAGRLSLQRTLESVVHQLEPGDEVIVVGDTHSGELPATEALCASFGARYIPRDSGSHTWGHTEINIGMDAALGDYIVHQDDDDVATPDAFDAIRDAIAEQPHQRPLLFQFVTPWREVLWSEQVLQEGCIGGHCLVHPNVKGKIGYLPPRYAGDFDYIAETVRLWDGDVVWVPRIIAWTRPTDGEWQAQLAPKVAVA